MTLSYYPRGGSLYVRLTINKVPYRFAAKIQMPIDIAFDGRRQAFKGTTTQAMKANSLIAESKALIMSIASRVDPSDIKDVYHREFNAVAEDTPAQALNVGRIIKEYYLGGKNAKGKQYAEMSLKLFKTAHSSYLKWGKDIDLSKFDMTNTDISSRKVIGERWFKAWRDYDEFMSEELECGSNTRAGYLRLINVAVEWAKDKYYLALPKPYMVDTEDVPIVVLDPSFVKSFIRKQGLDQLMFEVSAMILTTTLRMSDIESLRPQHFVKVEGSFHLRKRNKKTGAMTTIPLHPVVSEFLSHNISTYGSVFCKKVNHWVVREQMPEFFSQFPECQEMTTVVRKGREIVRPLWEYCKPHMLRKSAITTMIYDGVDTRFIKFASGHSQNSPSFERYVAHVDRVFRNKLAEYYDGF